MILVMTAAVSALGLGACVTSLAYTSKVERTYPASGELVPVDGHDVHVIRQGTSGPLVLMIHGASANAREFTWTLAPRVEADMRVLIADRPGHGHSERFSGADALGAQAREPIQPFFQIALIAPFDRCVKARARHGVREIILP